METINTFGLPFYGKGGKIHIKKENRGKFNATKKRTGKTTEELTHSKNPLTRKRAIFAQNAKKWKHQIGGYSVETDPYKAWLNTVPLKGFVGDDYDLERAFYELPYETLEAWKNNPLKNHLPDTYKLPNHETFSEESVYSEGPMIGGTWQGDKFVPSVINDINKKGNGAKVTPFGQWEYPGEVTIIPSNEITMEGVNYPVVGVSNTGERKLMLPWMNYKFNGDYVTEYPLKHQTNPYIDLDTFSYNNKTYGNNRKFNMDNMKLLDEYFIGKGVPLNQRQAILFNVLQESGADTLDAHGNGYYGIMGWSKDRYDSIKDKSLLGQAEYLYNTLYNGNGSVDWNHGGKGSGYNSWTDAQNMFINGKTFDDINHALVYGYIRPSSDVRNYRTTNGSIYFQPKKLEGSFVPLPTVDNKITDYSRAMAKGLFEGNNIANIVGTTLGAASTLASSIGGAVRAKKQGNADINQDALEHNGETLENKVQLEHPERAIRIDDAVQMPYSSPLTRELGSPIPSRYSWNQQGGMPSIQAIIEGGEIVDYPDGTQLIDTGEQHEYSGERTYRPDGKIDGDPVEFTGIPMVDLKNNPNLKLLSFGANPWAKGEPFIWPSTVNQHGYVNTMVDRYFPEAHNKNELKSIFNQPYYYPQKMKLKRSAKKSFGGKMQLGLTTPQVNFFAQKQKLSPQAQMQYDAWANAVIEDSRKKEPTTWDNIKDKAKEVANWLVYDDTRGKAYAQQPYTLNDYYQDKKQMEENAPVPLRYMANAATYLNPATSIPATILDIASAPKEDMDEMFTRVPTDITKHVVKSTLEGGLEGGGKGAVKGLIKSVAPLIIYPFTNRFWNNTSQYLTGKNIEENFNDAGVHPKLSHTFGTFAGGMTAGRLSQGYSRMPENGRLNLFYGPNPVKSDGMGSMKNDVFNKPLEEITDKEWNDAFFDAIRKNDIKRSQMISDLHFKLKAIGNKITDNFQNAPVLYHGTPYGGYYKYEPHKLHNTIGGDIAKIFDTGNFLTTDLPAAVRYAAGTATQETDNILQFQPQNFFERLVKKPKTENHGVDKIPQSLRLSPFHEEQARVYSGSRAVYPLYVFSKKPFIVDFQGRPWSMSPIVIPPKYAVTKYIRSQNKDVEHSLKIFNDLMEAKNYYKDLIEQSKRDIGNETYNFGSSDLDFDYGSNKALSTAYYTWDFLENGNKDSGARNSITFDLREWRRPQTTNGIVDYAKSLGYDAVIMKNVIDANTGHMPNYPIDDYVIWNPKIMKLANAITRDDKGNIIPITERHNFEIGDYRFALGGPIKAQTSMHLPFVPQKMQLKARKK